MKDGFDTIHASVPACMLASIGLQHHNSAVLWPVHELSDPPAKLTLHPISGSCVSTVQGLRQDSIKNIQALIAAWIDGQSEGYLKVTSSEI